MKIRAVDFVLYQVSDFRASVLFYRDVLGLPLELCSNEDKWAEFNCGNVTLALRGGVEVAPGGHAPRVALAVENVRATSAELAARGARVSGLTDYGVCQCIEVLDPDDNVVAFHHRADDSFG